MSSFQRNRLREAVSLVSLILIASWCALKVARCISIYSYYSFDPGGAEIARRAHILFWIFSCLFLIAIGLATRITARILDRLRDDMMPTGRYLIASLFVICSAGGLVAAASIVAKHSTSRIIGWFI
jgi:hypothetical protein